MQSVRLVITGKEGAEDFVHQTLIPSFISKPEVIIWGSRCFKYLRSETITDIYVEVFYTVIP